VVLPTEVDRQPPEEVFAVVAQALTAVAQSPGQQEGLRLPQAERQKAGLLPAAAQPAAAVAHWPALVSHPLS
jgi:hypothetical protein